jgi:glycosyltransferase involved in cell wall biosynthesis
VRVCISYDCLYPYTVGGAERWYRELAERLAEAGHTVTYLTLRQWDTHPEIPGVTVIAVGPRMHLYTESGRRRMGPPLRFGAGVLRHLLRHSHDYDIVHTASFPYFSLLAAALARRRGRYQLVVDWVEVWSFGYWKEYLGPLGGRLGWAVQRACIRVRARAFCYSQLHAARLRAEGFHGEPEVLPGLYVGPFTPEPLLPAQPLVVFAGRHIPEKCAPAVVPAVALATNSIAGLRGVIFGDGPERDKVLAAIDAIRGEPFISAPGFTDADELHETLRRSLCMLLPSRREGYGMVVVEAAACGVPSIVVAGPDNAAVELIEEGVNGVVAPSAKPEDLAAAVLSVYESGIAMRESTLAWFVRSAASISTDASLKRVLAVYGELSVRP